MKKFTKVVSIVLSVMMLVVLFAGCGAEKAASDLAFVEDNGKMVIGYTIYAPMNYEENGELTGFDTEFAEAVCENGTCVPVIKVGVNDCFGKSGPAVELLHIYGLDAQNIVEKAKKAISMK